MQYSEKGSDLYLNIFSEKLKEVFSAVLPVTIIVTILSFTLVPIESKMFWTFLIGAGLIIIGLTLFLIGVDIGITPLGAELGPLITKRKKLWIVIIAGLILGFFISFAEPGLMILANQIDAITSGGISSLSILIVVSLGMATMVAAGFVRILYNVPLYIVLNISYFIIFIMAIFASPEFLAIAFDASGATTGILAVPFILALSLGITSSKKDSKGSEKDSFGLLAIASAGAIASVLILNIFAKNQKFNGVLEEESSNGFTIIGSFVRLIPGSLKDSIVAFLPLIIILIIVSIISSSLSKREIRRISFGFVYAFIGMFVFFLGVNAGFMHVGSLIGSYLTTAYSDIYLILIGFVIGVVTILAEPAVHVLTHQIQEVTSGYVTRKAVLAALSLGVGISVALSMLRIITPEIQLWHYLLPGYIISLALTFIVPKLFVGIAFDAGGVATGPMTATFILAFTNGAAHANPNADLMRDGFGMIAMVALMPIITLQILGLIFKIKTRKKGGVKIEK